MEAIHTHCRLCIQIQGAVQGVGFRPFIYRLATGLGLNGWVKNDTQGVIIVAEGMVVNLQQFLERIEAEKPPHAILNRLVAIWDDPVGYTDFVIRPSDDSGAKTAFILPDLAICPHCLAELFDPEDRRYQYPFINCTHCGPRFTIIQDLPYDRPSTSMTTFQMCPDCQAEYDDPTDRRFHAQPNACPTCGPQLALWTPNGKTLATRHAALLGAVAALRKGQIVAVKGLSGFHLMAVAHNGAAIRQLRACKHRPDKPFALMYPSLTAIEADCFVSVQEADVLMSAAAPIVLLRKRATVGVCDEVAPQTPDLGVMLPYTPLHHLLLHELGCAVVATSGNLTDEPICIDEAEALKRLRGVADVFLVHDRPILRHADDSIVRVVADDVQILRRARGYTPLPIHIDYPVPPAISVGAHQKSTVAIAHGQDIFLSQHVGDLETVLSTEAFEQTLQDLLRLYDLKPDVVVCDKHPDYHSTRFAEAYGLPVVQIQHHVAHVLACMAENGVCAPVLGVAWDGTGYGDDGTIWGGEFFYVDDHAEHRVAHLRTFPLPGGDVAVREPRRSALGLRFALQGEVTVADAALAQGSFLPNQLPILQTMLQKGLNAPVTSSIGRFFDAVAALIGLCQVTSYEGQAAMRLEASITPAIEDHYPFAIRQDQLLVLDWEPVINGIVDDLLKETGQGIIAAKFHNTMAEMIVAVAQRANVRRVILSGGCFQNRYLTERAISRLRADGFIPYWHHQVPPNDGGIALGQMIALARKQR